jgi:hypothetical protein
MGGAVRLVHPARHSGGLKGQAARPLRARLHHLAFSAESREQVDAFRRDILLPLRATVLDPPQVWPQYSEGLLRCGYIAGAGAIAAIGAMTIRTRLRRTDHHRGDTGVAAGQAADLEAAATALSSLSFGLGFVDQLVFGADCEQLRLITRHVARVYAAGLAPQRVRWAARVR